MTPFGLKIRELRARRGFAQKDMAAALGVSAAYLSALEHGRKGAPSFEFVQRVITYFNIIWDDADEVMRLASISHPRVVIDTTGLSPEATLFANELAVAIPHLDRPSLEQMRDHLRQARENSRKS